MPMRRIRTAGLILLVLLLALILAGPPLGLLAIERRLLDPPAFSLRIGDQELAAPCPPPMAQHCGQGLPYYAVWRGVRRPDGTTNYRLIYFAYLPRPDRD